MDETTSQPASAPDAETLPRDGSPSNTSPNGLSEEEVFQVLTEELGLDPAFVEWVQQLGSEVPAEALGYLAAMAAVAGTGVLAGFLAFVIPLILYLIVYTAIYVFIAAIVTLLVWLPFRSIPREHRRISSFSIWLTVIPIFGIFWNFRVVSRIPASFRAFFAAYPEAALPPAGAVGGAPLDVGGAGKALGMWYAGLSLGSWLAPWTCVLSILSVPLAIAALVLYILFLVTLFQLSGRVSEHRRNPQLRPPQALPEPSANPPEPPGIA